MENLRSQFRKCSNIVAENDLILATGHLNKTEIFALVSAAKGHGVRKVVITHPTFSSIALSKEEQKELADLGAFLEICVWLYHSTIWNHMGRHI